MRTFKIILINSVDTLQFAFLDAFPAHFNIVVFASSLEDGQYVEVTKLTLLCSPFAYQKLSS